MFLQHLYLALGLLTLTLGLDGRGETDEIPRLVPVFFGDDTAGTSTGEGGGGGGGGGQGGQGQEEEEGEEGEQGG